MMVLQFNTAFGRMVVLRSTPGLSKLVCISEWRPPTRDGRENKRRHSNVLLMVHSASQNSPRISRIISNPPVSLKEPFNFNGENPGEYSRPCSQLCPSDCGELCYSKCIGNNCKWPVYPTSTSKLVSTIFPYCVDPEYCTLGSQSMGKRQYHRSLSSHE